jgi:hypothetical protein
VKTIDLKEPDLDRPLYRIYSIWFFEMALITNGGNLALVPPARWDDPHEDPCAWIQMSAPGGGQKSLSEYLQPTYAQCWSMDGGSDALLRAYSRVSRDLVLGRNIEPQFEGVKVRTTPRLIINALEQYLEKHADQSLEFFVAKVTYVESPFQMAVNRLGEVGPTQLGTGFDRARSLTFKRKAFEHEQEVRVIALARPRTSAAFIAADIKPNEVFQEVSFDPRLMEFERREREARVRALGYTGPVNIDASYARTFVLTPLPRHWEDLDANAAAKRCGKANEEVRSEAPVGPASLRPIHDVSSE